MRTLSRYLLTRFFGLFVLVLVVGLVALLVFELTLNFDQLISRQESLADSLSYALLRLQSAYVSYLLPISAFGAAFLAIGTSSHWRETLAIKSGGISIHRALLPVIAAGAVLAASALLSNEIVGVPMARALGRQSDDAAVSFRRGSFWYHRGRTIYNVAEADPETGTLRGVQLYERGPRGRLLRSVRADRVQVESERTWRFDSAVVRTFDPKRAARPPVTEEVASIRFEVGSERDLALVDARMATLSLAELREYIEASRDRQGDARRPARIFHTRLANSAGIFVLTLFALPLGLQVERRRGIAQPALAAVVSVIAYFSSRTITGILSSEGVLSPALGSWLVLGVFGAIAVALLMRAPR